MSSECHQRSTGLNSHIPVTPGSWRKSISYQCTRTILPLFLRSANFYCPGHWRMIRPVLVTVSLNFQVLSFRLFFCITQCPYCVSAQNFPLSRNSFTSHIQQRIYICAISRTAVCLSVVGSVLLPCIIQPSSHIFYISFPLKQFFKCQN